ncbi:major facilitator superfamily domain-containing protein [Chaetomium strumarium]|uniref:Major facilitator superfamily domain-containing protein n=1 Tax=Chaetomium strumarium TaxID=1170767 RepID=A0AAJ0GKS8_9PEZI|nr:major facilitator superfamily domain-containing protein [Chaetomium strumarium]
MDTDTDASPERANSLTLHGTRSPRPRVTDPLLAAPIDPDLVEPEAQTLSASRRKLLWAAGPGILLCLFTIDFDMLFLSTNYSKRIASDLHELDNAVWVILLGSIMETASNPFYSRLGDLLGRRRAALLAAFLTAVGLLLCSLSSRLWQLTLSRLVVGSGSAGFPLLVAIMLTDIVPLQDFALWRSLIVCVQAVGDVTGGPVGSSLADKLGWHWVFRVEFLVMAVGFGLVFVTLHLPAKSQESMNATRSSDGFDALGPALVFTTIALPLFALNTGGSILPWTHPVVVTLLACTPLAVAACYWSQTRSGVTPFIRVALFKNRAVIALMMCVFCLVFSFSALLYNLALYIEARSFHHPSSFGDWALSCIVFARPIGSVLSGFAIKQYRAPWRMLQWVVVIYFVLYKAIAAGLVPLERPECASYLFIFGLSIGVIENCLVVSLLSTTGPQDRPSLLAIFNVVTALASDVGMGVTLSLTQRFIRSGLQSRLGDGPDTAKIIQRAVKSLESIRGLSPELQSKVISIFVGSIEKVLEISCAAFLVGVIAVLCTRVEYKEEQDVNEEEDHQQR